MSNKVQFYTQAPAIENGADNIARVIRRDTDARAGALLAALGGLWSDEPADREALDGIDREVGERSANYRVTVERLDD